MKINTTALESKKSGKGETDTQWEYCDDTFYKNKHSKETYATKH